MVDGVKPLCPSCGKENEPGARFCSACGTPLNGETAAAEKRKTVTILFCDLAGSTSMGERLDSESVRRVMTRYFAAMRVAVERHGGTVEKFIGDAVMAVFGIPTLHEDDAVRALRAATDMGASLRKLNEELRDRWGTELQMRIGVNTGEVVAGDPSRGQSFVVGDSVNVTARLEQAAPPGGILLGEQTYRLARDAVKAEPVEPLELKGKAERVPAFRLLEVSPQAPSVVGQLDSTLVGRDHELAWLSDAFERVVAQCRGEVVAVLGPAGIGKSRLTQEFAGTLGGRASVLQGRCLSYGEGITFWPLSEVVRQASVIGEAGTGEQAQGAIARLFTDEAEGAAVAQRIAAALGLAAAPSTLEETFWAVRRLLEALARERPLVVVFDDIHWADPTFLDLLEYVREHGPNRPVMVLLLGRPELRDVRPALTGAEGVPTVMLEPLGAQDSKRLITNLLGEGRLVDLVAGRVTETAQGNPLFVEELLRMLADEGLMQPRERHWSAAVDLAELSMPPTIQAVLGARLDRLGAQERVVTESASVVGQEFWRGAVEELAPERLSHELEVHLLALIRKDLIHPAPATLGEDTFRFSHVLIRDAAYAGLLKEARAELHERFAVWLERRVGERAIEYEEILGYHLEQAYRYREALGPLDNYGRELALRAAERLGPAGGRALRRGDMPAAASLLGRAVSLLPTAKAARRELQLKLALALCELGEIARAVAVLDETAAASAAAGDRRVEVQARLERSYWRFSTGSDETTEELRRTAEEAIPVLERARDDAGLARAWGHLAFVDSTGCRWAAAAESLERGVMHARKAAEPQQETELLLWLTGALQYGPAPAEEGIRRLREILDGMSATDAATDLPSASNRAVVEAIGLAGLEAMRGNFETARTLFAGAKPVFEELGQTFFKVGLGQVSGWVELLAGDFVAAETALRPSYEALEEIGEKGLLSTTAALLAEAVYAQSRYHEAEELSEVTERSAPRDDVASQVLWRGTRAKVLARRAEFGAAEALARETVELATRTDDLNLHADKLMDLAEVIRLAGRPSEAAALASDALELYRAKGNVVSLGKASAFLERVDTS